VLEKERLGDWDPAERRSAGHLWKHGKQHSGILRVEFGLTEPMVCSTMVLG